MSFIIRQHYQYFLLKLEIVVEIYWFESLDILLKFLLSHGSAKNFWKATSYVSCMIQIWHKITEHNFGFICRCGNSLHVASVNVKELPAFLGGRAWTTFYQERKGTRPHMVGSPGCRRKMVAPETGSARTTGLVSGRRAWQPVALECTPLEDGTENRNGHSVPCDGRN